MIRWMTSNNAAGSWTVTFYDPNNIFQNPNTQISILGPNCIYDKWRAWSGQNDSQLEGIKDPNLQ